MIEQWGPFTGRELRTGVEEFDNRDDRVKTLIQIYISNDSEQISPLPNYICSGGTSAGNRLKQIKVLLIFNQLHSISILTVISSLIVRKLKFMDPNKLKYFRVHCNRGRRPVACHTLGPPEK
ncbi:hypothetical protein ACTFIR_005322 [Dictyostelium discoideum]